MRANVSCFFKILAFSETQFKGEHPHGQTISAKTLQTTSVVQTLSNSPNLKKSGLKFRKLHFHSEMSFRLKFSLIEIFMLAC